MGKKSLIKSTTKKKKESGKTAPKASKKDSATAAGRTGAKKATGQAPPAASPEIPDDPRGLLFRQFPWSEWPRETIAAPSAALTSSPPFVRADDPAEADRIRDVLLNRRHTMAEIQAVAEPPAPVIETPAVSVPVDPREVLFRQFPWSEWPWETIAAPSAALISAPPFVRADDPVEADRIRDVLLNRRHTMAEIQAVAEPPAPATPVTSGTRATDTEAEAAKEPEPEAFQADTVEAVAASAQVTVPPPAVEAPPPAAPITPGNAAPSVPVRKPADPLLRYAKYAALGFALLILVLIGASYVNSTTCHLNVNNGATELWEGRFSPMGKALVTTLKGFVPPDPQRTQYKRKELYPAIFSHYLKLADDMAASAAMPDFRTVHAYLTNARRFAVDETMRNAVGLRLNSLTLMTLLYKADVAVNQGSDASIAAAARLLDEARKLATDPTQVEMIQGKLENVEALLTALKAEATAPAPEREAAAPAPAMEPQAK